MPERVKEVGNVKPYIYMYLISNQGCFGKWSLGIQNSLQ